MPGCGFPVSGYSYITIRGGTREEIVAIATTPGANVLQAERDL